MSTNYVPDPPRWFCDSLWNECREGILTSPLRAGSVVLCKVSSTQKVHLAPGKAHGHEIYLRTSKSLLIQKLFCQIVL